MLNLEEQIFRQIEKAKNILISFNANWGGDAIASSLALFLYLKAKNKNVEIAASLENMSEEQSNKSPWNFLPAFSEIRGKLSNLRKFIVSLNIGEATINQIKYTLDNERLNFIISPEKGWFKDADISYSSSGFKYDLIFVIDSPDLESLASIYDNNVEFFYKTILINIDHKASNEEFGQINLLDLNLVSSAELLYWLFKHDEGFKIDEDIATCLLAGIIDKTKNFKNPNLSPRTLLNSSKLIKLGARREEIVDKIYRSKPIAILRLWGEILKNLQITDNKLLAWSYLPKENDIKLILNDHFNMQEIFEEIALSTNGLKQIIIAGPEFDANKTRTILYSNKGYSSLESLRPYTLSGDASLANALIPLNKKEWEGEFIKDLAKRLEKNNF